VTRFLPLLLVAGCATELEVQDHGTFFPTVRVSKKLSELVSVDVIADYSAGSDTASGSAGLPIVVGGQSFPGAVDVDFDMTTVRLELRTRKELEDRLLLEGFLGVVLCDVDVTVKSGTARAHEDTFEAGPHFGGRVGWLPAPRLQVYAESYIYYPFPDGIVPSGEVELGVEYRATGPMSVFGGWRFRNLEVFNADSDYDFEWSGPFLGIGFDF